MEVLPKRYLNKGYWCVYDNDFQMKFFFGFKSTNDLFGHPTTYNLTKRVKLVKTFTRWFSVQWASAHIVQILSIQIWTQWNIIMY